MTAALLTVRQVAEYVQLSEEAVRRATRRGELEAFRVGGRLRFSSAAVERWIHADIVDPGPQAFRRRRSANSLPLSHRRSTVRDRMKQNRQQRQ